MGIFSRINKGLKKTRENMSGAIDSMLHGKTEIDDEFYDELEEILVMGDVGCMTASEIVEQLRERVMKKHLRKPEAVKNEIKEIVAEMLEGGEEMSLITLPSVILVIGVNGVGKTTTIGKLAHQLRERLSAHGVSYSKTAFFPHISLVQHPTPIVTDVDVAKMSIMVDKICVMKSERVEDELVYSVYDT